MCKAKKQEKNTVANEVPQEQPVAKQDPKFVPDEKLQSYYNEAYINERERLNAMFGRLDTYPIVKEVVIEKEPDYTNYVEIEKYNKKRKSAIAGWVFAGLFAVAAAVFAVLYFLN